MSRGGKSSNGVQNRGHLGQFVSNVCLNDKIVNPVPRTYVRGFGALPLQGVLNIHPRAYARGVLWYGVKSDFFSLSVHVVNLGEDYGSVG